MKLHSRQIFKSRPIYLSRGTDETCGPNLGCTTPFGNGPNIC